MFYQYSSGGRSINQIPGGGLGCLLFAILAVVAGYYLLQGLYYLLLWAAPALLVLALIVNWRVYPDTIKNWVNTFSVNPVSALLSLALAVLVFPFFALYLFLKALGYRKLEQMRREFGGDPSARDLNDEYVEYEELESKQKKDEG